MLLPAFFMSLFAATIAMNTVFSPTILAAPAAHPAEKPLASVHNRPQEQSSGDPLVLAFYYTWFDENTWTYDKLSELPAEPNVSRDRGVMGRHIDQAKAAGIDAFLVAWYGPGGESNQTEPNLAALLDEAAARNFKIGILFETDSPFLGGTGAITGALQHAIGVHAAHPAFLRVDGRPVIFFWRPTIYGVDTWRAIRDQADPGNGTIWIAEGVDTSYLAVFDGHHLYSNTWNPPADLTYTNQKFAGLVEQGRQAYGAYKFWVATVMPGYNDVRIRPGYGFARDRAGGGYYEQAWQAAIGSNPNWVVITSFNEWPEGTYIEPSAAYGNQYLNLTAAWSGAFKAGGGQAVAANVVAAAAVSVAPPATATPAPTPTPFPEPTVPTVYVQTPLLNLRAGPGTDTFAIVGQVTANSALPIIARDATGEWWQVATDDGSAWLASAYVHA
ncbi:MAG: SH3 domain-containing protein, partial [Caldilineaceae bacterium]|nr:SH3 domain-containing protein [Caldilineaceae bacterium]